MAGERRRLHSHPVIQRQRLQDGLHLSVVDGAPEAKRLAFAGQPPQTLEVALAVQTELESRCDETERLRLHEVERARYQSDQARRRFMHVDPGNRLVADTLEAEWNQALRTLADAKERYEKQRQSTQHPS